MDRQTTWVGIPEFPSYAVNDQGEVKNLRTGRILVATPNGVSGHARVTLSEDGVMRQFYVRRLVAQAFLPHYRDGAVVKNVNGDTSDNRVANVSVRRFDDIPIKRRRQGAWGKRVVLVQTGQVFASARDLARYIGGDYTSVYKVLRGVRKSHMGYTFRYHEEQDS